MKQYRVILFNLLNPDAVVEVAVTGSQHEARRIMSRFRKGAWTINRRPDIDTLGNIVLTFRAFDAE
jgi:hypothetical protein